MSEEGLISKVEIEETSRTIADLIGVEVGQDIDSFWKTLDERTQVAVGQNQDQWQVQIEMELNVSDAESMIIFNRIVLVWQ